MSILARRSKSCFNPRSREGNDEMFSGFQSGLFRFQSTFPRGERQLRKRRKGTHEKVSIHVPARGTTIPGFQFRAVYRFQSTFPRGERPEYDASGQIVKYVSIHVPARGTTNRRGGSNFRISSFNPRSREGNDGSLYSFELRWRCFNPRSREGNDGRLSRCYMIRGLFQSTFPRGERRRFRVLQQGQMCFNPRSREGNDYGQFLIIRHNKVFQSTFPRGERL